MHRDAMADKDPSIRDSVIVVDNSTTNHVVSEKNDEYYCPSCNTRHPTHPKTYECISGQDYCKRRCEDCDAVLSKKYRSMHFDISGLCNICATNIFENNADFLNSLNEGKLQGFEESILKDYDRGYYVPYFEDERDESAVLWLITPTAPEWKEYFDNLSQLEKKAKWEEVNKEQGKRAADAQFEASSQAADRKQDMYVIEIDNFDEYLANKYYCTLDPDLDEDGNLIPEELRDTKYILLRKIQYVAPEPDKQEKSKLGWFKNLFKKS